MVVEIPLYLVSHHRKIANVYKKWVRLLEGSLYHRHDFRYEATLARAEFNCIYYEKDVRISKAMLKQKEKEIQNYPTEPKISPTSPGGIAYNRYLIFEDFHLDRWHPTEKAIYPEYFARRELRKQQYVENWNRTHGPPKPEDH